MALSNINICYATTTPYQTVRITLMMSAEHYQTDTIEKMDALSTWGGADNRRRSENLHNTVLQPEVQELSWEIKSAQVDSASKIMDTHQKTLLIGTKEYLRELKKDPDIKLADRIMSGNGSYPSRCEEAV